MRNWISLRPGCLHAVKAVPPQPAKYIYNESENFSEGGAVYSDIDGPSNLTEMIMMTSSIGNIFRVTGPLYGEFTGDR